MRWIGVLLMVSGCEFSSMGGGGTPGGPVDGSAHGLGMFVNWNANPPIPGVVNDKFTVSDATFQVDHLQIVADSGSVTQTKFLLAWDASTTPQQDAFPDAPPGMYSKVTLVMAPGSFGSFSYRIHGTWRDSGETKSFLIEDPAPVNIGFDCNEMLAAAGSATIGIKVDFQDALGQLDLRTADDEDGVLELHDGTALSAFRGKLMTVFKLDD